MIILGVTKKDFSIQKSNFDIRNPWNILRITSGAFLLPHALGKFVNGAINPAVLGFFGKAGFQPPETWVLIAFLAEVICSITLVMGICSRFAALGAAITLILAVVHIVGYGAVKLFYQHFGHTYQVAGLVIGKADAAYVGFHVLKLRLSQQLRLREPLKEWRRYYIHPLVCALGAEYHCHQQLVGVGIVQLRLCHRHVGLEPVYYKPISLFPGQCGLFNVSM